MIFGRKKQKGEVSPREIIKDLDVSRDTVAAILRTLAQHSLPTTAFSQEDFLTRCEQLALEILVRTTQGEEADRPYKKALHEAKQLVRMQRAAESKEYSAHKEGAQVIVGNLVAQLRRALEQREGQDQEMLSHLDEMERAVGTGDLRKIQKVSSKTAHKIRRIITVQREREQQQLDELSDQLRSMRQELSEARSQAETDALTELHNRAAFDKALTKTVSFAHASGTDLTLFLMDLDHFKSVNDRFGHPAGDKVLKLTAAQLIRAFPRKDDLVARYGGEEFVALCRNVGDEHAGMLGERARGSVSKLSVQLEDDVVAPTISVGYAVLRRGEQPASLLKRADEALYDAKRTGRNKVAPAA